MHRPGDHCDHGCDARREAGGRVGGQRHRPRTRSCTRIRDRRIDAGRSVRPRPVTETLIVARSAARPCDGLAGQVAPGVASHRPTGRRARRPQPRGIPRRNAVVVVRVGRYHSCCSRGDRLVDSGGATVPACGGEVSQGPSSPPAPQRGPRSPCRSHARPARRTPFRCRSPSRATRSVPRADP